MRNRRIKRAAKFTLDTFAYSITSIFIFSLFIDLNLYDSLGNLFLMTCAISLGAFVGEYKRSKENK